MALLGIIFLAGVMHGLGPDHLAAITAFGAAGGQSFRRISFFSLRFAAGHAAVIGAAGLAGFVGHGFLPVRWERAFDLFAGGLLVLTGVALLVGLATGRLALHSHEHEHAHGHHRHFHMHWLVARNHQHAHGTLALGLGALFALGGARTLLVVVPIVVSETALVSLLRVGAFTLGIALAMAAYGLLAGRAFARLASGQGSNLVLARLASVAIALFSIVAGLLTIFSRLGV